AGDTLLLQSQIFEDGTQFLENLNGTPSASIVLLAENEHQTIYRGGTESIHLINCSYIEINGLVIEQQTGNGMNIDDGGDYDTPSKHICIRNCIFHDMDASGNNDLLKMSGVDSFLIENCKFTNGGAGGSGSDFVGCHWGTIQDCYFDNPGSSGIQNKGGTQHIRIQRNIFKNVSQRALNLGGSTGLQFFRPPLGNPIVNAFEAADLEVFSNVFIGSWAPIAYVGAVRVKVYNNTFYQPQNWVIRILQETNTTGFLPCADNEFSNNIVYLQNDLTEVNIGPNTDPGSFTFSNNLWFNESSNNWTPNLPVPDIDQVIDDPLFEDANAEDFHILENSSAIGAGFELGVPGTDFDQNPFLTPPSIGAFEGGERVTRVIESTLTKENFLYPNPTTAQVTIEGDFEGGQLQLYNAVGTELRQYKSLSSPLTISLTALPSGWYFVAISKTDNNTTWVSKIYKQD
ncbi:MAG: right-handed parallel beta-helix repeat-containing protein, partial [Saprospiraceae bacterium]|nr:right-handed parallel beta-helix repeat-containing protein [Saprospiraceae bacterium]